MRSSRISRDTSALFSHANSRPSSSPPRRTTRSSLARFSYSASTTATPDIEDLPPSPPSKRRKPNDATRAARRIKEEIVEDAITLPAVPSSSPPRDTKPSPKRRKPARKVKDEETGSITTEAPSNWEEIYKTVQRMRKPGGAAYPAAVDTMGCERLADPSVSPRDQRFHTLVALMLSSQTKDTVNAVAMKRLQTEMPAWKEGEPKGLNLENMLAVDPGHLNEMIWQVGFHNNKTKYLKAAAIMLRDNFGGDVPKTIAELTSLPGVGPKMGYLTLSAAWNLNLGIGVDVHVHRITNLWGWHPKPTKSPEETRLTLESWLPQDKWREINGLLVGLGQAVCLPVGRRCGDCDVGLEGLCKAADKGKVNEGRRRRAANAEAWKAEGVNTDEIVKVEGEVKEQVVSKVEAEEGVLVEETKIKVEETETTTHEAGVETQVLIKQEVIEDALLPESLRREPAGPAPMSARRTRRGTTQAT